MKMSPSSFALAAVLSIAMSNGAFAQAQTVPDQVARPVGGGTTVRFTQMLPPGAGIRGKPGETAPPILIPQTPRVTVMRSWDEQRALIRVPLENDARAELKIEGVQTTGSLYIVGFPKTIAAGAKAELVLAYAAEAGTHADLDLVKLLTNQGTRFIEVAQDREPVAGFETNRIQWKIGDVPATKNIILVLADPAISAKAVRVGGNNNKAGLINLGGGRYRIEVTPASTAKRGEFPVFVEFEPALTGVPNVIVASVVE